MHDTLSELSAQALEWPLLLELLAHHARSTLGAARCRALPLADELGAARMRQQETTEMVKLVDSDEPFPAVAFPDIRDALARAVKGGVLEAKELSDCGIVLASMDEVTRCVMRYRLEARALAQTAAPIRDIDRLRPIQLAIDAAIQPDGAIKESATPELRRLTHHSQELKQEMRRHLEEILRSKWYAEILQESYFAQREGRYVVPVKADMRGRISGIVHDVSASGATVFIEPRELVELNNAIKVADLEIEREIRRILRDLTELVASVSDDVEKGVEVLVEFDSIRARAELSRRLKSNPVSLNEQGRVVLKQARHPLLMMAKKEVVPNDIVMDETVRVLVISGPNTGGKTVTLKIVGLYSLMVRAGLHLPCAAESEMALFTHCYADIGDAQDLSRDLSSFSAHMAQMIRLLSETVDRGDGRELSTPRSLVLLDEPVTSTDPQEGAALAEALLCRLASLNMKVVATTHYGPLKELAQTTSGFANASVEFDIARLAPTYRLFLGIPGGSSALEIAGRLGMDPDLVSEARRRLRREDRRLDDLMAELHLKQRQLVEDAERVRQAREETELSAREAKALQVRLEASEQEARKGIKKKLGEQFQRARAEVHATVETFKREQKLIKAKEAKQRLSEMEARTRRELAPAGEPIPVEQLGVGDTVEIVGLGMTGSLLEAPQGKKRVRVKVGEGEVLATVSSLVGLRHATPAPLSPSTPVVVSPPRLSRGGGLGLEEQTVIDVRGQASDQAVDQVVAALDQAALTGAPFLRIIHGHGTGRLKAVVRAYLKSSPYVEACRSGDRAEGGDGVTVAKLR